MPLLDFKKTPNFSRDWGQLCRPYPRRMLTWKWIWRYVCHRSAS